MTVRLVLKFFSIFFFLSVSILLFPASDAGAQSSQSPKTLYWCRHSNGTEYGQLEPCSPGAEVRTQVIDGPNGLASGRPVEGTSAVPTVRRGPTETGIQKSGKVNTHTPEEQSKADVLKEGQMNLLKTLGFGLVFGIIAKFLGRSFVFWFLLGVICRILLVAANILSY